MLWVNLYVGGEIRDGPVKLAGLSKSPPAVQVDSCIGSKFWIQLDRYIKISNRLFVLAGEVMSKPPGTVSPGIIGIQLDGPVKIQDGLTKLAFI